MLTPYIPIIIRKPSTVVCVAMAVFLSVTPEIASQVASAGAGTRHHQEETQ